MTPLPARAPDSAPAGLDVDALVREHGAYLGRLLARLVGDGPHVDDLLQETFLVAFRDGASFEGRSTLRTWLAGVAIHRARHHHRAYRRFSFFGLRLPDRPTDESPERPDQLLDREEDRAAVHATLAKLSPSHREVFVLYELEEMEGVTIAEMLGIPLGTVWTRLHHARKSFVRRMRAHQAKERS